MDTDGNHEIQVATFECIPLSNKVGIFGHSYRAHAVSTQSWKTSPKRCSQPFQSKQKEKSVVTLSAFILCVCTDMPEEM